MDPANSRLVIELMSIFSCITYRTEYLKIIYIISEFINYLFAGDDVTNIMFTIENNNYFYFDRNRIIFGMKSRKYNIIHI